MFAMHRGVRDTRIASVCDTRLRACSCGPYRGKVRVMAVLLGAGGARRFAGTTHKLLAELGGQPLWTHALGHLLDAGFADAVMITGAADIDAAAVRTLVGGRALDLVHNPLWDTGQASSVQLACRIGAARRADALVIGLADQPFVTAGDWRSVADADAECELVVATYGAHVGPNPVRIAAALWPQLPSEGDEGARSLLRRHGDRVCSVACIGSADDIDTLEDLARWTSS